MIKTIIFDLAEVCLQGLVGVDAVISKETGVKEEKVIKYLRGEKLYSLFKGDLSEDDYWNIVLREGGFNHPVSFFKETVRANFTEIPGTREILEKLKKKGYQLILLSDHTKEWIGDIESKFPFLDIFEYKCYSFDSREVKLSPESFKYALNKVGANPETTLFIDDHKRNLDVAKSVGIRYVYQFTSADRLKKDLKSIGVKLD